MDHPTSLPSLPISLDWRRTAIAAAALAAFELLLLVMIALALLGKPLLGGGGDDSILTPPQAKQSAPVKATPASKPAPTAGPKLARTETSVMVLNGNGGNGAASEKADLIRTRGYLITGTGNAPHTDFARTIVMYRPGYEHEARRLARDFRLKQVTPLDGLRKSDLQGAHLALIVGAS
jgi:hypothetical protein